MGPTAGDTQAREAMAAAEARSGPNVACPTQLAFWRAFLTTTPPYLSPISGLAGLTGISLAQVRDPWRWAIALFVFSLPYGLRQALPDCFQQDTDRPSAPYRPLVQGRAIRGGTFRSVRQLTEKIELFVQRSNTATHPLVWVATADSTPENICRLCSLISGTQH